MNNFTKAIVGVAALLAGYAGYEYYKSLYPTPGSSKDFSAEDFAKGAAQGALDAINDAKANLPKKAHPSTSYSTDLVRQSNYERGYASTYNVIVNPPKDLTLDPKDLVLDLTCEEIFETLPDSPFRFVPIPAIASEPSIRAWAKRVYAANIPNDRINASAFLSSESAVGGASSVYSKNQVAAFMAARECLLKDQVYTPPVTTGTEYPSPSYAQAPPAFNGMSGVVGGQNALGVYAAPGVRQALAFQNKSKTAGQHLAAFTQAHNFLRAQKK